MLKKSGKIEGSNLRILAIAYANNRIDRKTYLRLRTQQLSALDFGKPLPSLPMEIRDINVPTVKIDSPHINRRAVQSRVIMKWGIAVLILAGIATTAYIGYVRTSASSGGGHVAQPSLEQQAHKLLESTVWSEQDMETFTTLWSTRSDAAKAQARQTEWFYALENEIIKRINETKLQRSSTGDLREYQNRLNMLRVFYAEVVVE